MEIVLNCGNMLLCRPSGKNGIFNPVSIPGTIMYMHAVSLEEVGHYSALVIDYTIHPSNLGLLTESAKQYLT